MPGIFLRNALLYIQLKENLNVRNCTSFMKMANYFYAGLAVVCFFVASFCGASPRPDTMKGTGNVNTAKDASDLKIPHWLLSAFASMKQPVADNGFQAGAGLDLVNKLQDSTLKPAEDALPVLLHKEDEETGMMIAPPSLSNTDKVNPFFRTKRSVCTIPANLTQMVRDLNSRLTPSQLIGLNPGESTPPVAPTNQPNTCPTGETGDWWPRTEVNLRSTCPWTLQQVDLGTNAFPRYV